MKAELLRIPIITDAIRNIDGSNMVRCTYFSIQSDHPAPGWTLTPVTTEASPSMILLNFEAILVGPPQYSDIFRDDKDIAAMYDFIEKHEELFVDINDIWVPHEWFDHEKIDQGLVYRITLETFQWCWKLRNDVIASESFRNLAEQQKDPEPPLRYSEIETRAFKSWTENQMSHSQQIYHDNRERYLQKIKA